MIPESNFPRINNTKGTIRYEHYENSKTRELKKDGTVTVNLGGKPTIGRPVFFFTDDKGVEYVGVTVERIFMVRKVADIVS